jgi:D-sedoheptulose 7-phosphate isomerase
VNIVSLRFEEMLALLPEFERHSSNQIQNASTLISNALHQGRKLLLCGNGGSAADSQHLAAEFVNAFSREINRPGLPAVALSTDSSVLTSIANDFAFEKIFSRQVEALGTPGDVLIAFTTSGNSLNCMKAVEKANSMGMVTIAFTRMNAEISALSSLSIEVPSRNTQHIQECHILAYHIITELVENKLFKGDL